MGRYWSSERQALRVPLLLSSCPGDFSVSCGAPSAAPLPTALWGHMAVPAIPGPEGTLQGKDSLLHQLGLLTGPFCVSLALSPKWESRQ